MNRNSLFALLGLSLLVCVGSAPATAQDALFVDANGNVGVGASTPTARLDILPSAGSNVELSVKNDATNTDVIRVVQSASDTRVFRIFEAPSGEGVFSVFNAAGVENLRFTGQANGRLGIGCAQGIHADIVLNASGAGVCGTGTESAINAGATQFTVTSSRTLKKNIVPFQLDGGILDKISQVGVYQYDFIAGPEDKMGLIAEEFHQIFGRGSEKLLDGHEVQMALWLAVQELAKRTDNLADRNELLTTQNAALVQELELLREGILLQAKSLQQAP